MTFTIKVKNAYKKDQWEVSIEDPPMKEKSPELGDALRILHRKLIAQLQNDIVTPNRIIVTLGVIKASGSEEIDEDQLRSGGQVYFDIEDMRISTSFLVNFSKDRTLDSFSQEKTVFQEVEGIVNSGALDGDGYTCTISTHKAGAE